MSTFDKMVLLPKNTYNDIKNQIEDGETTVQSLKKQIVNLREQIKQKEDQQSLEQNSNLTQDESENNDHNSDKDEGSPSGVINIEENQGQMDSQIHQDNESKTESEPGVESQEQILTEEGKENDINQETATATKPKLKVSVQNPDGDSEKIQNVFTCPTCNGEFSSSQELKSHIKNLHAKIFECKLCDKKFETINQLNKHITFAHERAPERQSVRIRSKKRSNKDISSGSDDETEPKQKVNSKKRLNDNIQENVSKRGRFDCPICGKNFSSLIDIVNHENTHRSGESKRKRSDEISDGNNISKKKR